MGLGEGKGEGNLVPRSHISTFPNRLRSRYEIRGKGEGKGEWVVCVCVCVGGGGGGALRLIVYYLQISSESQVGMSMEHDSLGSSQ